jgi:hypothetical protein
MIDAPGQQVGRRHVKMQPVLIKPMKPTLANKDQPFQHDRSSIYNGMKRRTKTQRQTQISLSRYACRTEQNN